MSPSGELSLERGVLEGMRLTALLALLAVSAMLAACGSSSGGSDTAKSSGSSSSAASSARSTVLASAKKAKVGSVIVDAQGRTLYRFTAEAQGVPVCTGGCVGTWPPALVANATALPKHVATVKRPDGGRLQLTYDGHPLYRYAGDQSKADANGEGVGGQWFLVKAGAGAGSAAPKPPKPNTMGYNSGY
jgi:predicted lipoprotein with Yx(FWY)xxD motif